ncbi:MAG: hypothetical protein V4597_20395 [Pseudomonadota bacterium]
MGKSDPTSTTSDPFDVQAGRPAGQMTTPQKASMVPTMAAAAMMSVMPGMNAKPHPAFPVQPLVGETAPAPIRLPLQPPARNFGKAEKKPGCTVCGGRDHDKKDHPVGHRIAVAADKVADKIGLTPWMSPSSFTGAYNSHQAGKKHKDDSKAMAQVTPTERSSSKRLANSEMSLDKAALPGAPKAPTMPAAPKPATPAATTTSVPTFKNKGAAPASAAAPGKPKA